MAYRPSIKEVENAFMPAKEVDDAQRFAGRKNPVQDAYYALLTEGANLAIFGNRGIGKSSLARQVIHIANGNNELLSKLTLPHEGKLDFLSVYLACGSGICNYKELLEKLLITKDCLYDWIYYIPTAKKEVESYSPKFNVGFAGLEGNKQKEVSTTSAIQHHDIDTVFTNVMSSIIATKAAKNGILIVADEFDQIRDPSGFASFLKSLATNVPGVKFCIVGVAQDIECLMKEHQSADRLFAGSLIELPSMSDDELTQIIHIAESSIKDTIKFDKEATQELVSLAKGHPYMVHLIGKFALRQAFLRQSKIIGREGVITAVKDIATRAADPVLESRYKKAIASSSQREVVLRAMASAQRDGEIFTTDAYKLAIDEDVENSSQYVGQLVTDEYGAEIAKIRERFYRFKDSLFHAYVCARPRVFSSSP